MVMHTDLFANTLPVRVLARSTFTADANGTSIDMQGYQELAFLVDFAAAGDTLSGSVNIAIELEHSDDNSTFVDCLDSEVTNAVTTLNNGSGTTVANTGTAILLDAGAEANKIYWFGYRGNKRYVRPVYNVTGTHSTGTSASIYAFPGRASIKPANSQSSFTSLT
jgi:hypothetical protein